MTRRPASADFHQRVSARFDAAAQSYESFLFFRLLIGALSKTQSGD